MKKFLVFTSLVVLVVTKGIGQCSPLNLLLDTANIISFGPPNTASNPARYAFDIRPDSLTTKWLTPYVSGGKDWGVEFNKKYSFCSVRLVFSDNEYPTGIAIKASNDYTTWTNLGSVSGINNKVVVLNLNLNTTDSFKVFDVYMFGAPTGGANYGLCNAQLYARGLPNQKPVVSVSTNGSSYTVGSAINLTATATDSDGSITKVDFYQSTTKLGSTTTSPYSYTWNGAAQGTYSVTARAFDNSGDSTTSTAASVTVNAAVTGSNSWNTNGININNANTGMVFIGAVPNTSRGDADMKLSVNGNVYAKKITVTVLNWSDYIFGQDYQLQPLPDLERYILANKHLPGIPSEQEVLQNGVSLGDHQSQLLGKVEELTLYMIQLNKQLAAQQMEINRLKRQLNKK